MIAVCRQGQLSLSRLGPKCIRHRDRLEGTKAIGDLPRTPLVGGKARQLEDHEVTNQDHASFHGRVEPSRQLGKAAIAYPGPGAGIEECRPIELPQLQISHSAQERSRPAATSWGVPSTSRTTSNPLRTRRRAASRRAALTVSLRPSVPSSRRAASKARSSTSTVVRAMHITIKHQEISSKPGLIVWEPVGEDIEVALADPPLAIADHIQPALGPADRDVQHPSSETEERHPSLR